MRWEAIVVGAALVVGTLLGVALIGLVAPDGAPSIVGPMHDDAPLATASAPHQLAYDLANASFTLGLGSAGPVNATVSQEVDVPQNLSGVRVLVTPTQGASVHLHAYGLGPCAHDFGNVAASGQTLEFTCVPPVGKQTISFAQDSGRIDFALRVVAIPR